MGDTGITAYLAAAHAELGEWDRYETTLAAAFALPEMTWTRHPDAMPAHYAKGRLLHYRGLHAEAVDEVQRWLEQAIAADGAVVETLTRREIISIAADAGII